MRRLLLFSFALLAAAGTAAAPAVDAAPARVTAALPGQIGFVNYQAPPLVKDAVEPSIGVNWKTGKVMYQADLQTLRVTFDDSKFPATAKWEDVSPAWTSQQTLDPMLLTDSATGRTFVSQLIGQDSLAAFSDDDGISWLPSQGGGIPSGVDHQTLGAGPYAAGNLSSPNYPHAVYYCSQDVATAFCARSDDGGATFGAGLPSWNLVTDQCGGLHGHIRVSADGAVHVPDQGCGTEQAVAVSLDNGITWSVNHVTGSAPTHRSDPSIGTGTKNTIYFGYEDGSGRPKMSSSKDHGKTWTASVDVGAPFNIYNTSFPEVIAGDDGRVAYAYLGSAVPGNPESDTYPGVWYLYVSMTADGGGTWTTVNATPNDPVQRGCIRLSGQCPHRNLYDFNDIAVDSLGRVVIAYEDGCTGDCVISGVHNQYEQVPMIARLSCGMGLFAAHDGAIPTCPAVAVGATPIPTALPSPPSGGPPTPNTGAPSIPTVLVLGAAALTVGAAAAVRQAVARRV